MKRRIALLLAAILLVSVSAAAEEGNREGFSQPEITQTPAPNAFRFRDGIRWGMNMAQVSALETEPMTERSMLDWSIMLTDSKVTVSMFTADLIFMFRQNKLMMTSYEFVQGTQDSFRYLSGAISSLYGEKMDAEPLKIKALMDAVNPKRYKTENITQAYGWTAQDGTAVFLYYYSPSDFSIMYVCPELSSRIYQTNGL